MHSGHIVLRSLGMAWRGERTVTGRLLVLCTFRERIGEGVELLKRVRLGH